MKKLFVSLTMIAAALGIQAQNWMNLHRTHKGVDRVLPIKMDIGTMSEFSTTEGLINTTVARPDGTSFYLPYYTEDMDSITFAEDLTDEEKGHNKYRPFTMNIITEDMESIQEREVWLNCFITIDGKGEYSNYSGTGRIRGRGNSSWLWYDKKPYKFKLDTKSKLLGLEKAKNWNLLANYRDVTDMMNTFAFESAQSMGMPYTNHSRYVEVFLNHEYIGTYQLTEKIEIHKKRINIDETGGLLLSFDLDDGPSLSPDATDNFSSEIFGLPMCVKEPEDLSTLQIDSIKAEFAVLERAVRSRDYKALDSLADVASFISILQMHEFLYNVEIDAPRSVYMFRDKGGKYTFGPVWDWDAGYDFDWSDMYTGHTFFTDYTELIYGTDPVNRVGAAYHINKFWTSMFGNATFVTKYKEAWNQFSDDVVAANWTETMKYANALTEEGAYDRDCQRWPLQSSSYDWWSGKTITITFKPSEELEKMENWIKYRKAYLNDIIANYPAGSDDPVITDFTVVGTIEKTQSVSYSSGYSQSGKITISSTDVSNLLGGEATSLVPLNSNGEEGSNTAAKAYGAWFDEDGDTGDWGVGHVYIESDNMYSWAYGCHPDNCYWGDTHKVTMQYRLGNKAVNVVVTFNVN